MPRPDPPDSAARLDSMSESVPPIAEPVLDPSEFHALQAGASYVETRPAVVEVRGPGMVECIQGLLTNDVDRPGPGSAIYGALLTPKGMIVTDLWALRGAERFLLVIPAAGHAAATEILRRTLPPRLARATDLTGSHAVIALMGTGSAKAVAAAGFEGAAGIEPWTGEFGETTVARSATGGAVSHQIVVPARETQEMMARLRQAGAVPVGVEHLTAERIRTGWPALGAEIDEKTLPQEVRFDEIGGVSYTKGCYTGQETVARVHFRGHPNRALRGLVWEADAPLGDRSIRHLGREVGTVRSTARIGPTRIGLAPIRREVGLGERVTAGGLVAEIVPLPIPDSYLPR